MSLLKSCHNGDLEGVKAALESGADVNTKDKDGWTGLIEAVWMNHISVVELLLNTPNIDVNSKNYHAYCALHQAVLKKNVEALKLLLNVPTIDVNIVAFDGWSAVHRAVSSNNNEALKLLLDVPNIDVNIVDSDGESALQQAMWRNNNEGVKLLLDVPNIDVNIVDNKGESALLWAVMRNNNEGLKLLLKHRGLPALTFNQKDKANGDTPVMWAARRNRLEHLALLAADPRVDLDSTDKEGRSLKDIASCVSLARTSFECRRAGLEIIDQARLMRQVWKVLLDGLDDNGSPLFKLRDVQTDVVEEIIWKEMLVADWQMKISKPYQKMEMKFAREKAEGREPSVLDILSLVLMLVFSVLVPIFNIAREFLKFLSSFTRRSRSDVHQSLSQQ